MTGSVVYIPLFWVFGAGAVMALLLYLVVRQAKKSRCLRYCYLEMSDWAGSHSGDTARLCRDELGDDTPDLLVDGPAEWKKLVKDHFSIMKRAGIYRPASKGIYQYVLED
jgi:hypothetical protein